MRNKKFFAKALAFAMVMGTVGVHGAVASPVSVVKATAPTATGVEFKEGSYTVVITAENGEAYVCLQVLKDSKGEKVSGEYWYAVDAGAVTVDLSFLKATKKQYIRAYGVADSESAIVEIPAQPKTVIKYNAKTQKFVDKSKSDISDTDLAKLQYKTLYGSTWNDDLSSTSFDIANAATAGTTLVVRLKADATAHTPAGTEVKVKIAAVAKAPKVKLDFNKDAITLPKGVEIAVQDDMTAAVEPADWKEASGKLTQKELLGKAGVADTAIDTTLESGYTLFVRTKKTEKKATSNMAIVTVKATPVLKQATKGTVTNGANDKIACTFTDDDATLTVTSTDGTVWAYSLDGGRKWVTIEGTSVKLNVKKGDKFMLRALATEDTFASNTEEVENTGATTQTTPGGTTPGGTTIS